MHLVDIIDENIPKFCTFVTDRKQVNFIEDAILPHSSDSLGKECNTALKTSLGGSKTTFLPIKLQESIIQAAMYAASEVGGTFLHIKSSKFRQSHPISLQS